MQTAVFGTGIVGRVIANKLISIGHSVVMGTRDVKKTMERSDKGQSFADWQKENKSVRLETYEKAAASSEMVFNCTAGMVSIEALKAAGATNLKGKLIVDIANPLDFSNGMPPTLSPGNTDSLGEQIQRAFPDAKVVKTLNTMTCFLMVHPAAVPGDHKVFVSGNDAAAKARAIEILKSFGWKETNILDLGDITTARGTEQLLPIWLRLYGMLKSPMFNFNILVGPPRT